MMIQLNFARPENLASIETLFERLSEVAATHMITKGEMVHIQFFGSQQQFDTVLKPKTQGAVKTNSQTRF
jgi:hypothetical protein